ncbi:hypothetical protein [Lewinella sp. W8]|uniref:hypothetical protein n=1 Tax=Lewinella sp. W8 TaxID=2528208 RepID=UPI00106796E7|nr:hypothetical protein [Lewinella sp. W8]MTB50649.1 hypothetical protein [Lewinella sp. W8]
MKFKSIILSFSLSLVAIFAIANNAMAGGEVMPAVPADLTADCSVTVQVDGDDVTVTASTCAKAARLARSLIEE